MNLERRTKIVTYAARVAMDSLFDREGQETRKLLVEPGSSGVMPLGEDAGGLPVVADDHELSYSGLKPRVYLDLSLDLSEAIHKAYHGVRLLARDLYLNPNLDRADLSAWLDDGFPFELLLVSKRELVKVDRHRSAINVPGSTVRQAGLLRGVALWCEV